MVRIACIAAVLAVGALACQPALAQPPAKKGDSVADLEKQLADLKAKVKEVEDRLARARAGDKRPDGWRGFGRGWGPGGEMPREFQELLEKFRKEMEGKRGGFGRGFEWQEMAERMRKEAEKARKEAEELRKKFTPGDRKPAPARSVEERLDAIEKALEELRKASRKKRD